MSEKAKPQGMLSSEHSSLTHSEQAECNLLAALDAARDGNTVSAIRLAALAIAHLRPPSRVYACEEHREAATQLDPMCPVCLLKEINQLKAK